METFITKVALYVLLMPPHTLLNKMWSVKSGTKSAPSWEKKGHFMELCLIGSDFSKMDMFLTPGHNCLQPLKYQKVGIICLVHVS